MRAFGRKRRAPAWRDAARSLASDAYSFRKTSHSQPPRAFNPLRLIHCSKARALFPQRIISSRCTRSQSLLVSPDEWRGVRNGCNTGDRPCFGIGALGQRSLRSLNFSGSLRTRRTVSPSRGPPIAGSRRESGRRLRRFVARPGGQQISLSPFGARLPCPSLNQAFDAAITSLWVCPEVRP